MHQFDLSSNWVLQGKQNKSGNCAHASMATALRHQNNSFCLFFIKDTRIFKQT